MYPEPGETYPEAPPASVDPSISPSPPTEPLVRPRKVRPKGSRSFFRRVWNVFWFGVAAFVVGAFGVLVIANIATRVIHRQMALGDWLLGVPISLVIAIASLYGAFLLLRAMVMSAVRTASPRGDAVGTPDGDHV